jgi:3-phosphoshikimate 1-carboxyvinyltransferase
MREGKPLTISIRSSEIEGEIKAPFSKSYTHRALICAALSKGESTIIDPLSCDDTLTTARLCSLFGAEIYFNKVWRVNGKGVLRLPRKILDCHGSATTFRLLMAISSLTRGLCAFTGDATLRKRPVGELADALGQLGVKTFTFNGDAFPVLVLGKGLSGGDVRIRGDISSQFISGLIIASAKADSATKIQVTTEIQSRSYIDITMEILSSFGIQVHRSLNNVDFIVPSGQEFKPTTYRIPGDYSNAAFFLAAGALAGRVRVTGLDPNSRQGDREMIRILRDMGAVVITEKNEVTVERSELHSITIDALDIPDLIPICAVLATQARGETRIVNAERLRLKESDRLSAISTELRRMGANIRELPDGLIIKGRTELRGCKIDPHKDHRIAMACAVAALVSEGETEIEDTECVNKSYPKFFSDIETIGALVA